MSNNWHGIMKVLEIQHLHNNKIIWEQHNILNLLHDAGEKFLLSALFAGGNPNIYIPTNYYIGLDNRATITSTDTMSTIIGEPNVNGYLRQPLSVVSNGWTIEIVNSIWRATGNIITFSAQGSGGWGPVKNIFLTDKIDNSGALIASAPLTTIISLAAGEAINMRFAMALRDCP